MQTRALGRLGGAVLVGRGDTVARCCEAVSSSRWQVLVADATERRYRPLVSTKQQLAEAIAGFPETITVEEAVERLYRLFKMKRALGLRGPFPDPAREEEWLREGDVMSTQDRLLRPSPSWLGGVIHGDLTQGIDEEDLPESCI